MNPLVRRSAAWVSLALLAAVTLTGPPVAASSVGEFVVSNAASGQTGPVPRGALLEVFVSGRISFEGDHDFVPWEQVQTPGGVYVEASCGTDSLMRLPIVSIRFGWDSTVITVYYPNSIGTEPFGTCADSGVSQFMVHAAAGDPMVAEIDTVIAHPGIFAIGAIGDAPDGVHVDQTSGAATQIVSCNERLPADSGACPVRTNGAPAQLRVALTGSEAFACELCAGSALVFELAPVVGGVTGAYVPQTLASLVSDGTGVEKATIVVRNDTAPGEYRLRARNTTRPELSESRRVELGQPIGGP